MKPFVETRMLGEARKAARPAHRLIIELLIFLLLMLVASMVESVVIAPCEVGIILSDESFLEAVGSGNLLSLPDVVSDLLSRLPDWFMLVQLFATAGMIATVLVYCLKIEKRSLASLGLHRRGAVGEYFVGLALGLVLFAGAVGICCLTGQMTLTLRSQPPVGMILCFFVAYLVQGLSEELLCRGYLMVSLSRGYPLWACVLTNALLFAVLHLANPGMTVLAFINLTLFGVLASVYTLRRGSLWGIAALHSAWNFAQGNLFGLSVSGTAATPSLFAASTASGRVANLIHGGSFGPEGGLAVTLMLSAALLLILWVPTKKSEAVAVS